MPVTEKANMIGEAGSQYRSNSTFDPSGGMNRDNSRHSFPGYKCDWRGSVIGGNRID